MGPTINQVFGSNEYSVVGTLPESEGINEIKVVMKAKDQVGIVEKLITIKPCILPVYPLPSPKPLPDQITPLPILPKRCFPVIPPQPQPIWEQSPTEKFMERLWAYKRINYLSDNDKTCSKGIDTTINDVLAENIPKVEEEVDEEPKKNECEEEAIRLALKYHFVTDLTSLVIEENDEYINKGPIQIGKKPASTYPGIRASGGLAYSSYRLKNNQKYSSYAYSAPAPSPNLQLFSSSVLKSAGRPGLQFLQPALGGGLYYTHNPYTPNTVYYTPNNNFKKTPEDLTKLIKAYTDLSPDTKKFISERSQCQDWQKQAIVEFFENNLSIGCVKAFMQEILYENGCDQDYDHINTKSTETDQEKARSGAGALG